ncbi:MAG: molybdate ABC transporter permease subunit, partial [Rhizobiales bacterium]|nr:molybdate ABC transporter permease subunit [Hyphomicrobiales bacterium]
MNWLIDLSPDDRDALWLTLKIATLATCATLPFAVAVAYLLAR